MKVTIIFMRKINLRLNFHEIIYGFRVESLSKAGVITRNILSRCLWVYWL